MRREVVAMFVVALAWTAPAGHAADATEEAADRAARAASTVRIELVDALDSADSEASRAAETLTRDGALIQGTGLDLHHVRASSMFPSREPTGEIQARTKAALLNGEIKGALLPLTSMVRLGALFGVDQIPLLVVDEASSARLIAALAPRIDDRLAEHGLALIALLPMRPIGLTGSAQRPTGLPKSIAVGDAAGQRLAELIGARAVSVAAKDAPSLVAKKTVDAVLTDIAAPGRFDPSRPQPTRAPHEQRLLAMTGWPLAMIVVRGDLLAEKQPSVRHQFWLRAERQAEAVRQRWRHAISSAAWPATGGLMNLADAGDTRTASASTATTEPTASGAAAQAAAVVRTQNVDPELGKATTRLRAAALTMARDWATGAGADGFSLLTQLGVSKFGVSQPGVKQPGVK